MISVQKTCLALEHRDHRFRGNALGEAAGMFTRNVIRDDGPASSLGSNP
jgi:hypothetical protein